ncbi:MAG: type III pantothenate kinase [Eubacteriales bacterium]|nr:type III pantothenate kinase [Eubacteriales bacterium]
MGGIMILTAIIENTNTYIGCADERDSRILFETCISTARDRTQIEYEFMIKNILEVKGIDPAEINGGIIASCVSDMTDIIKAAAEAVLSVRLLEVGPGLKSGVDIRIDDPATLGADLLIAAAAGISEYGSPLVIANLCTVGTLSVIDPDRKFTGCLIIPGIKTGLESFAASTAALPKVAARIPDRLIGNSTERSMQSGVIYGCAASIEGLTERIREELGVSDISLVFTGEYGDMVAQCCRRQHFTDKHLMMKGLIIIYKKNRRIRT